MKTKNWILLILIAGIFGVTSCQKEVFPDHNDLKGNWIEKTSNVDKTQIRFENDNTIYLTKPNQPVDTFNYQLDNSNELLYLTNNAGESNHKIEFNKKKDEITIWYLFASIPENPSETTFERK